MDKMSMPKVELHRLEGEALELAVRICHADGTLRASKPPVDKGRAITGKAAYVWRMVAFYTSPKRAHQCMPVCAEFDLPREGREALIEHLDQIVNYIVDAIPRDQWHGVRRWGQAYGWIGSPTVAEDGAIIYR